MIRNLNAITFRDFGAVLSERPQNTKNIEKEVIEHDITAPDILECIDKAVDGRDVDIIIGGPPCQAYSSAGRVRDKKGMEKDARNYLFESYVRNDGYTGTLKALPVPALTTTLLSES